MSSHSAGPRHRHPTRTETVLHAAWSWCRRHEHAAQVACLPVAGFVAGAGLVAVFTSL